MCPEIGELGVKLDIPVHVDACLGGNPQAGIQIRIQIHGQISYSNQDSCKSQYRSDNQGCGYGFRLNVYRIRHLENRVQTLKKPLIFLRQITDMDPIFSIHIAKRGYKYRNDILCQSINYQLITLYDQDF